MPEERREREITIAKEEIIKLGRGVLPVVIEALKDPAPDVRRMAIPICGTFRDPAAIDPLVKCMRAAAYNPHGISSGVVDFTHGLEQQYCLESLVEIGPGACGPLMEGSKGCEPEARACLPGMIAQNWGAAGVPQLIGLLEDSDGSVRAKAALNLGGFKDKRATDPLIGHLIDVDEVSHNAALALGEIADSKAIPALQRTLDNTHLGDSDRIPAAGALARMGRNDGLDYLLALLRALNPADVRMMVADALGTDRIKGTIDPLLSLLEDSDENVQITAVQNLGQLHDPRAIPALRKMKDENEGNAGLRYPIVQALKELGDKTPPASQPASKP
jgi:HEAT repeat protein